MGIFSLFKRLSVTEEDNLNFLQVCRVGDVQRAKEMIENGANVNFASRAEGATPLHNAVRSNSLELCRMLIENGADLDSQNCAGETPLLVGCKHSSADVVCLLLCCGADVWIACDRGVLPLFVPQNETVREVLHCYAFEDGNVVVELKTVVTAMTLQWPLLNQLIDKEPLVVHNHADLVFFRNSLPEIKSDCFVYFFSKFHDIVRDMLQKCCFLTCYLNEIQSMKSVSLEFINVLYSLLDSSCVHDLIQSRCRSASTISILVNIFHKHKFPLKILTELVCCMLSYGLNATSTDLNAVYVFYGRCELFEIMLHMDVTEGFWEVPCCALYNQEVLQKSTMLHFLCDVSLTIDKFVENPLPYLSRDLAILLNYFAHPLLKELFMTEWLLGCAPKKLAELPKVPYLTELARNVAREHIIDRYKVKNSRQFYTILKWLPINKLYKRILTYEVELY